MTQHRKDPFKATRRAAWRIGLSNAELADVILDGMIKLQTKINATVAKLASASPASMPTDFSINKIGKIADWGTMKPAKVGYRPGKQGHGHRQSLRWALLHALYSEDVTNEFLDAMDRVQKAHDNLCEKLDAQAGTLSDVDFSTLVVEFDADKETHQRSKASFRTWLISTLSSYGMTNDYVRTVESCQKIINEVVIRLDARDLSMPNPLKVLDPKAKI